MPMPNLLYLFPDEFVHMLAMKAPPPGYMVLTILLLLAAQTVEGGCRVDELPEAPDHADREGGPNSGEADVGTKATFKCKTGYEIIGDPVPYITKQNIGE